MPFVQAAAYLPDYQFVVVGAWKDEAINDLRAIATPNVAFTGRVSDAELLEYYRAAWVYVQASAHEGFGLSLAEAMLAGCIPVIARVGSLPEVVGEVGIYMLSNSAEAVAKGIRQALTLGTVARQQVRDRILACFPLENRRQALLRLVESQLNARL
jgi:glycosyltransferase involved in cell wall biosynthesis